jgi:hypothetical protein
MGNKIGRITPSGIVTEFPIQTANSFPLGITAGPDGNLWFTEYSGSKIGMISQSGTINEFTLPAANSMPALITTGPDGNLWFTESPGKIGRITPIGTITEFSSGLSVNSGLYGITSGPDGNLWFTDFGAAKVGRITTSGTISEFANGLSPIRSLGSITLGSDGNLWFTQGAGNRIVRTSTQPSAILRVVAPSFPTDAYHFHTLQDALANAVGAHDTIQIEPGASPGVFPSTTLAAAANAGDTSIITNDYVSPAEVVLIGNQNDLVDAVAPAAGGFYTLVLHDPLTAAQTAGTAVTNQNTIGIDNTVTIQGDPNAPPVTLVPPPTQTSFEVWSGTVQVTLINLNILNLTLDSDTSQTQVLDSNLHHLSEVGGPSGNGQNLFEGDTGSGFWDLSGNMNPGLLTSDQILDNHFTDGASVLLADHEDGTLVQGNSFSGQPGGGKALEFDDSQHVTVARNTFDLTGGSFDNIMDKSIAMDSEFVARATSATIVNNVVSTSGQGTGLFLNIANGTQFEALIQGNDFHDNVLGVNILGDMTPAGALAVDLGGGSEGDLGTSAGGNNFRSFTASGTANGVFAVYLQQTKASATVSAQNNIWSVADPNTVIKDGTHNTNVANINGSPGTGMINVGTTQLTASQQFVQTLYNHFLQRSGSLPELNFWVSQLPNMGRNGVANAIIRSDEGYRRLVDGFYLQYLGRPADPGGETSWAHALEHGATEEQVIAGFLASPEYYDHATALASSLSPDANFVQSLYEQLLGRLGGASEIQGWVNLLPAMGRSGVTLAILNSSEALTDRVLQFYAHLLHRPGRPLAAELNGWVASKLDTLSIEVLISGSQEFFTNG